MSKKCREQWRNQGLCIYCGAERDHSRSKLFCKRCLDEMKERQRLRRQSSKKNGLCALCHHRPIAAGSKHCKECREAAERKLEHRRQSGLCVTCGEKVESGFKRCKKHLEHFGQKSKQWRLELRKTIIDHYSGGTNKCACCEEPELDFLTIDHIGGGGSKHVRDISKGKASDKFYRWLLTNNFPDGFQVLCWNCNCGRAKHKGVCPHKLKNV